MLRPEILGGPTRGISLVTTNVQMAGLDLLGMLVVQGGVGSLRVVCNKSLLHVAPKSGYIVKLAVPASL